MKFNENLAQLVNYEAGKPIELVVREFGIEPKDVVKLASNENPFGTSERVVNAIKDVAKNAFLYPDDSYFELKNSLASKFNIGAKNIIIGSGSDQVIEFCIHAKANEKNAVLMAGVTFAMYEIYTKHVGAKVYRTKAQEHDLTEFLEIYKANKDEIAIIFLCLPNNPLGGCLDADEVYKFLNEISKETLVVFDCAYNEFAEFKDKKKWIDPAKIVNEFKNAIYLGTFSKAYGLGGMRVGYGIADENIIAELGKIRSPFNITTLSLKAAIEALKDEEFVTKSLENNFKEMTRYEEFAREFDIEFIPSYTNFITFKFKEQNASEIVQKMLKKGIILRDLKSYGMNALRITIGQPWQNDRVLKELKEMLK
ncbi:histidinol-phosphate transaminase [Campylobacter sp. RM13119]|uniref:histidinol-phosphate transaminase n=1 Tax=Campylobacter TaxID=194 RepID=UPI001474BBDA|nr:MULTISPECIES: histidinol-phosphate transaminase [unclassified Campylobacter]MBE3022623.1 histidinol-phosphate transaminase [Campylobacter sp. 7477a]MBE3605944.1 histidinol-phosphate transaminase [Campylobacter sp. RM13119]MBE3609615.1 histidinol-phosphate transaminase [Campylobacter sp. RM12916]